MRIRAKRESLANAFSIASAASGGQTSPMPILQNVKLEAIEEGLILSATDMEIGIRYRVSGVDVLEKGKVCLNAARMTGIVREDTSDTIEIDGSKEGAKITGKNSLYHVLGEDPEEFPAIPTFGEGRGVTIGQELLAGMLEKTIFSAATEATRYSLNGVLFDMSKGKLLLVATDGRRLAKIEGKTQGEMPKHEEDVIVPVKGLTQLVRLLGNGKEEVQLKVEQSGLLAKTEQAELFARLVEGHFPPYQEVVPKESDKKASVSRETLLRAVRQASLMTSEESRAVKLHFFASGLTVSSQSPQAGDAKIELDIAYDGAELDIAFNPQFLIDFLKVAGTDAITIEMKDKDKPAVFKTDTHYLYLVMPVSLE